LRCHIHGNAGRCGERYGRRGRFPGSRHGGTRRGDLQARLRRLAEATGDSRWDLIAANIVQLQHPTGHFSKPVHRDGANLGQFGYAPGITVAEPTMVPAESAVNTYLAAAKQIRDDIRELAR
jgi:hypothetical protein